jgi:hypothetical protein
VLSALSAVSHQLSANSQSTHGGRIHTSQRSLLFFWHAYHRNSPPVSTFGARLSNHSSRCDLSAVRLAAAIALASPTVPPQRRSVFDSSELSLSWLEQRLHLAAKTSASPCGKPDGDSLLHSSLVQVPGAPRSGGTKIPRASTGVLGTTVTNLRPAGLSLLSPDRLLSLLDV